MKDPLSTILLTLGFTALLSRLGFGANELSIISVALLSAGLFGLHRVLEKRAPLFLIGLVVAIWVLQHFWDILPVDSYKLASEHKTLSDAPGLVANIVFVALLAAIPIAARPRIGNGLMALALASLAMGVLAKGPLLVTDKESSATVVFSAMERGWLGVTTRVSAIVFLTAAFEPKTAPLDKRGLVIVAVIGAALFAAVYDTLPEHVSGSNSGLMLIVTAAMALAWILSAIGFAGVARAGGGKAAWAAMALSIVQVPMLLAGLALMNRSQSMLEPMGSVMAFGLLAIGIAAVSAPSMGARLGRGVAGVLALSSLFGTLLTLLLFLGEALRILRARKPEAPIHEYAMPLVGYAAVAWAASLAYLVAPPSAKLDA